MSEEIETTCSRMMVAFQLKTPVLGPQIVPKGYHDLNLVSFCKTDEQRAKLKEISTNFVKNSSTCPICNSSESTPVHFTSLWSLDLGLKTFTLDSLSVLCNSCRILVDLNQVLEIFGSSKREKELKDLIRFWGVVNKFDYHEYLENQTASYVGENKSDNEEKSEKKSKKSKKVKAQISTDGMEAILQEQFQEAYSLAYSIQVIAGNFGQFKVLDNTGAVLNGETDVVELAEKYLGGTSSGKKSKGENGKSNEKKQPKEAVKEQKPSQKRKQQESEEETEEQPQPTPAKSKKEVKSQPQKSKREEQKKESKAKQSESPKKKETNNKQDHAKKEAKKPPTPNPKNASQPTKKQKK